MIKSTTLAFCFLLSTVALAENLGIKAQTYPIDQDARETLKNSVKQKQQTGELDKFWHQYREKNIQAIKYPAPLGIKTDYSVKSELRHLQFTMKRDMRNEKGNIIVKAGSVIEPLKVSPLIYGLIFIDGRDQRQVDYAIAQGRKEPLKIVLTAGSPYALRVKYKNINWWGNKTIPFYFDQRKMIINTLQRLYSIDVNTVPVKLAQRGDKLEIKYGMSQ